MKSCYHLIKTMTKFEKETRHWLIYVFIKKPTVNSAKCKTTASAHDAFCPLIQTWQLLQAWCVHCLITVQIVLVITNLVQEFCCNFDQVLNQHVVVQSFFWSRLFQTKLSFIFVQCFLLYSETILNAGKANCSEISLLSTSVMQNMF